MKWSAGADSTMNSPILFTLFTSDLLHEIKQCCGVMLGSKKVAGLMFADDLVLLASNEQDLQYVQVPKSAKVVGVHYQQES